MKVNEGKVDRILRAVIGLILLAAALIFLQGALVWVVAVVGVVLLVTAASGFCGLYALLGINTAKNKSIS
ncbi:DUF2892 domain-containing protein [candidate division KSB1 bacterium]|nr:DUF2892 domain-containing protein [candidate division KSB1 bacterium]